mgnify:CR=1 FL=1
MAQIKNLANLSKSTTTNSHYVYVQNIATSSDFRFQLNSIFPTISDTGSAGVKSHNGLTNTTQLNLRKIAATSTSSGALTSTLHTDGHVLLSLVEASLDLNNCNNSTSGFLSTVNLTSNVGATILPVANGGTGVAEVTANSLLYGRGTASLGAVAFATKGMLLAGTGSVPQTLAVGTNDFVLTADSSTATGLAWKVAAVNAALTSNLDVNNNNIDMGTNGRINGDGSATKGIQFDASGNLFTGDTTAGGNTFDSAFNVKGGITLVGATDITTKAVTSGAGSLTQLIGGSSSNGAGGSITIKAGSSTGGGGNGGSIAIQGGAKEGGGVSGSVSLQPVNDTNSTISTGVNAEALVADQNLDVTIKYGNAIFHTPTKGIVYTSRGDVTQLTNHSTLVTSNAMAGIITLAAVSLASGAEAEFRVTNSSAQADSLILLTVESVTIGSSTDDSVIIAQIGTKSDGHFNVVLKNVGDAATDTNARKVHYMIVNNSV